MLFYGFDITYLVLVMPAIVFAMIAQASVSSNFKKYSGVRAVRGITGADAAKAVLRHHNVTEVKIEQVRGTLSDHFDPRTNIIRLSDPVYGSQSLAAVGVAAHEAGHAVQHANGYLPIKVRNLVLPVAKIGSFLGIPLIIIGMLIEGYYAVGGTGTLLMNLGFFLFAGVALFQLVTLPVEFNASRRAVETLENSGILMPEEIPGAKKVLRAAALTYVAALAVSLAQLLRLFLMFSGGRRR